MLHMKNIIPYPCVKFGQRKNLEALKNGEVFFSTLKTFINDSTDYRGDPDEGASYIDPSKVDIKVDGKSLFHDLGVPFPSSVRMTHVDDEKVHIFSCCALRKEVWIGTKSLRICDEVKHEMMFIKISLMIIHLLRFLLIALIIVFLLKILLIGFKTNIG